MDSMNAQNPLASPNASAVPAIALSRRSFTALGAGALSLPVLAACGGGSGTGGGAALTELKVAFPSDSENYDPHQPPYTVSRAIARQIADTLVDQDPESGEIVPWLATAWEVNEDSSQFTFTLRDDVTFSDGTAFNATSVKNNFDRVVALGALAYIGASHLRGYVETVVENDTTARVVFDGPNAQFLQAATTQTLSMLADATLALEPEAVARGEVIGSGPFVLESYTAGQNIVLTRRDDYAWGSSAYENTGAAPFEKVTVQFIPDATTMAGAVNSGQVDFAFLIDSASLASLGGNVTTVRRLSKGIAIPLVPFIYRPIFQHAEVRRAINHATNRQEIVDRIFQGNGAPATAVLTEPTPGYADLGEYLTHDVDQAVSLLEEGGWVPGADGIRVNADGERLSVEIKYEGSGTAHEQMFQLLQTQWKEVGIEFVLSPTTSAEMSEYTLYNAPYDMSTWSQGRNDPDVLRVVYSSFYENQSFFFGNAIPEIDEALLKLQSTTDQAERDQAAADAQRLLLEGGYVFPLYDAVSNIAGQKSLTRMAVDAENKPAFADFAVSK